MDGYSNLGTELSSDSPLPPIIVRRSWDPSLSVPWQRLEFPSLSNRRLHDEAENVSASNDTRQPHVTFATETGLDTTSPELHTLASHNMWVEKSGSKPLETTTNNPPSKNSIKSNPDYHRVQGPWKKRFSTPGSQNPTTHLGGGSLKPPSLLRSTTSSSGITNASALVPLLRQATSAALLFPAGLRFHPSVSDNLIAEPMMKTPKEINVLAKRDISFASSFQPDPNMSFTPAEALLAMKSSSCVSKKPAPIVTQPSVARPGVFEQETPYATLFRGTSSQYFLAPRRSVNTENRDGALAFLHAVGASTARTSSSSQIRQTMHPFSTGPRICIQGPPRRPYFSPLPTTEKKWKKRRASETIRKPTLDLTVPEAPQSEPQPQPRTKKNAIRIRRKKTSAKRALSEKTKSRTETRAPIGTIVAKSSLFENVPISNRSCKCEKTHCLKLYCECFHGAMFCDPVRCRCKSCKNLKEFNSVSEPKGDRVEAMLSILSRRPSAFVLGGRKAVADRQGCRCQKSGCVFFIFNRFFFYACLRLTIPPCIIQMFEKVLRMCCRREKM